MSGIFLYLLVDAITLRWYHGVMGLRGPKPKGKVKIKWSANFAYAIGLIATDGCLYKDGRHISLTSLDLEQLNNFNKALDMNVKISTKQAGAGKSCTHIQFSDVLFHRFLISIGVTQAKSKTISGVDVPKKYFFDFLRGCLDGDGCFYSYWDPRWRSSHMFYLTFSSASLKHIEWLRREINERANSIGHISKAHNKSSIYNLKYAKKEALVIIKKMYYSPNVLCLSRKKEKIQKTLLVEKKQQCLYV
ncbi:MAG: hypothetical protein AAB523_03020 [Patescibacteria group bacterium]